MTFHSEMPIKSVLAQLVTCESHDILSLVPKSGPGTRLSRKMETLGHVILFIVEVQMGHWEGHGRYCGTGLPQAVQLSYSTGHRQRQNETRLLPFQTRLLLKCKRGRGL